MNKSRYTLSLAILYIIFSANVFAENTVNQILTSVLNNNTDLKAYTMQLKRDSIEISATNYLEDPSAEFEYLFGDKSVGNKWAIGISQSIEWPGIYGSRRKANKSKLSALSYSANMKRLEILYQTKLLCLQLVNINKQIAIQQNVYNNYNELYDSYSIAFDKNEVTILDINKLRIELANTAQQLELLKTSRDEIVGNLISLNGGVELNATDINNATEYPCEDFLPLDEYIAAYYQYDPESGYYDEIQNAYKAETSVARMGWFPQFDIGFKYSNEIGDGFTGFTIGTSIPLFFNRKKSQVAKAQEISNLFTAQSIRNSNEIRIKTTFAKAVSLKSQLATYQTALEHDDNHKLLQKALQSRQMSLLDYIQESIYFLNAQIRMNDIEYEYQSTMAELNKYSILPQF